MPILHGHMACVAWPVLSRLVPITCEFLLSSLLRFRVFKDRERIISSPVVRSTGHELGMNGSMGCLRLDKGLNAHTTLADEAFHIGGQDGGRAAGRYPGISARRCDACTLRHLTPGDQMCCLCKAACGTCSWLMWLVHCVT